MMVMVVVVMMVVMMVMVVVMDTVLCSLGFTDFHVVGELHDSRS